MNSFFRYLRAEGKRTLKLYPAILLFTLVLVLSIAIILATLFSTKSNSEAGTKIKVGIVGNLENSYLDIGIAAFQNADTTRFYIEFLELPEQEANRLLKTGELKGYVYIPDGFVDSVAKGGELKLKYVMGNSPAVLSSLLMQEIIDIIGNVIVESQCAVYGYIDLAYKTELEAEIRGKLVSSLSVEYIDQILSREQWYDVHVLGIGQGLSFESYYVCAFLILLFLLWGTVCVNLLTRRDLSLPRLLYSKKRNTYSQILAEYIPFFCVFLANIIILSLGAGIFLRGGSLLPNADSFADIAVLGLSLIPAALVISSMQFMLYNITSSVVSAVLLQILALVALSYASGLLYPLYSLPETLQSVAPYLPTGVAFSYASRAIIGDVTAGAFANTIIYSGIFLSISAAIRSLKIRGGRI